MGRLDNCLHKASSLAQIKEHYLSLVLQTILTLIIWGSVQNAHADIRGCIRDDFYTNQYGQQVCGRTEYQYDYNASTCTSVFVGTIGPVNGIPWYNCVEQVTNCRTSGTIGGCNNSNYYGTCSAQYQQSSAFDAKYSDDTHWEYFSTSKGGIPYKCRAYYKNNDGECKTLVSSNYHTVDPENNADCMTQEAFDARHNTNCNTPSDAHDTGVTTTFGNPGATTESDEYKSGNVCPDWPCDE